MYSLNHSLLLGTLTRPPTFRQSQRGTPIRTFDLQLDPTARGEPCIMRVIIWGEQGE